MNKKKIRKIVAKFAVSELFTSIQGESSYAGRLCFFIRLAGCNLSCDWCDTLYARTTTNSRIMTLAEIVSHAIASGAKISEITGGEPLMQDSTVFLCNELIKNKFTVLLETNGSYPIDKVPEKVKIILDCKCPSSGQAEKMLFANFAKIKKKDEIKFVIAGRRDYEYAKKILFDFNLLKRTEKIFFNPVVDKLHPAELAEWIISDKLPVIFGIQLHKIIWGKDVRGR